MQDMIKREFRLKRTWWVLALFIMLWSFMGERFFFDFSQIDDYGLKLYIIVKLFFCLASLGACYKLKTFNIKRFISQYQTAIQLAKPIIIVYITMFMLFYPGIWIGDDMCVLEYASRFDVLWEQGLMITVWDMFWMMLVPIPAFLVLLQQIILVGIAIKLFSCFGSNVISSKSRFIVCIPFLLPSTLYYMLFTHKSSIVALLELIVVLAILGKEKNNKYSVADSFLLGIVIAIMPGLRTETYIIAAALILALIFKYGINKNEKQIIALLVSCSCVCILINIGTASNRDRYSMIYMVSPLAYMLQDEALNVEGLEDEIYAISKVVNVEYIKSSAQEYVNHYIWCEDAFVAGYSDQEFIEMKYAYWRLVLQNPKIFLENRILQFLAANEMTIEDGFPFVLRGHYSFANELQINNADGRFLLFRPMSDMLRSIMYIVKIMLDRSIFRWSFNFILEIIIIFVLAIKNIKKREWSSLLVNMGFLCLTGVLFLLTPEANMMYYLGVYYLGLFYIFEMLMRKYVKKSTIEEAIYEK